MNAIGSLRSDEGAKQPGGAMPGMPAVEEDRYPVEVAPAIAEYRGTVAELGNLVTATALGACSDTASVEECAPLEEGQATSRATSPAPGSRRTAPSS